MSGRSPVRLRGQGMPMGTAKPESNSARRKRLDEDIDAFVSSVASEYAREASWRRTDTTCDEWRAEVKLELSDGSERFVPLREPNVTESGYVTDVVIDVGDAGALNLDAAGLYAFLWNHDATELRDANEELTKNGWKIVSLKMQLEQWREDDEKQRDALTEQLRRMGAEIDELQIKFKTGYRDGCRHTEDA